MRDMSNVDQPEVFDYKPERALIQGIKLLEQPALIGHNIANYDIPLIKEQYPDFDPRGEVLDTLVLAVFIILMLLIGFERRPAGMLQRCADIPSKHGVTD